MCRFPISYGINRINKTMADKLMFIFNDDTQNYPFNRLQLVFEQLDTQLYEQLIIIQ